MPARAYAAIAVDEAVELRLCRTDDEVRRAVAWALATAGFTGEGRLVLEGEHVRSLACSVLLS